MIFCSIDKNWILHNRDSTWNKDNTDMVSDSGTMGCIYFNFLGIHIQTTVWFRDQHTRWAGPHKMQSAVEQLSGLQSLTFLGSLSVFCYGVIFPTLLYLLFLLIYHCWYKWLTASIHFKHNEHWMYAPDICVPNISNCLIS